MNIVSLIDEFAIFNMFKLRQLQKQKQAQYIKNDDDNTKNTFHGSAARLRLQKDMDGLELPPIVTLNVLRSPLDKSRESPLLQLTVSPDEGLYEGGHFQFELEFNENYPIEPPTARCLNRIFHPNIDTRGKICLNILREDWSPALDLQSIIIGIIFLFSEVSGKDPLNKEAANVLNQDAKKFAYLVKRSMAGNPIDDEPYDFVL